MNPAATRAENGCRLTTPDRNHLPPGEIQMFSACFLMR